MKIFSTGVLVGRFQHIHKGHEKLIEIGLSLCNTLLIFVGSADKVGTFRNPYDAEYRIKIISKIYSREISEGRILLSPISDLTNENDLTKDWGKYVIFQATKKLNESPKCIIYGKDKNIFKCFPKSIVKNITEVLVDRGALEISATKIREYLIKNDYENWKKYVNEKIYEDYEELRGKLIKVVGGVNNE